MKPIELSKYLGYSVAFVSLCAGVIFVSGVFLPPTMPAQLRLTVGIVFLLMSVYRFVATKYRIREQQRFEQ
jgi:hypothetical protein